MIIQALIYPNFTTLDLISALQPLSLIPSARVEIVARKKGIVPSDAGVPIMAEYSFETATKTPDVLLVPGGAYANLEALEDNELITFLARQGLKAKWTVAVCTGSLLLGRAGLLKGYNASSHWSVIDALSAFGATPVQERVVIDRNVCTGGGVTAGVDIGLTIAAAIAGEQMGKLIELILEYNPQPPFRTGHPSIADPETLKIAKELLAEAYPEAKLLPILQAGPVRPADPAPSNS
jgi:cyclohexyl-isocyanide hydratase